MAQVRVILRDDVYNLGEAGELVAVKPGYARNFLLPKGLATIATEANVKELEHHRAVIAERQEKQVKTLKAEKRAIEKIQLSTEVQAGEEGKLFGSVTAANIADLLKEQGVEIDRRKIDLKDAIKTVGDHKVSVKLHREVKAEITISVISAGAPPVESDDDLVDDDDGPVRNATHDNPDEL